MEIENLLQTYKKNKNVIRSFLEKTKDKNDEYIFGELVFCLLTPQAKAATARDVINKLKANSNLFNVSLEELQNYLVAVRFWNKKSKYVTKAKEKFEEIKNKINSNPLNAFEFREWLINNIKGFGLKESTHFLRNIGIGFGKLAIIDVHVQNFLHKINLLKEPKIITNKKYLELEKIFLDLSKELKIPAEELDIAIWLYQSGEKEFYG